MEKKQFKKLALKKETLISLQEKQMKAILGGEEMFYTSGETSGCASSDCNDSCCKKSCKHPTPATNKP
ncbi:class I lanthipeptide [Chitinophaga sp.]|uniref:class I lanthipeptide n=1 Tax=Chitinophaga sp. TaxID=1869181 RepID=UPI0031CF7442